MRKLLIIAGLFMSMAAQAATVTLQWDPNVASDMVTKYGVYWRPPGAAAFTKLADVSGSTSFTTINLAAGVYTFYITASNTAGESLGSNMVSTPGTPPLQPTGLKIVVP